MFLGTVVPIFLHVRPASLPEGTPLPSILARNGPRFQVPGAEIPKRQYRRLRPLTAAKEPAVRDPWRSEVRISL
jgi:hypothetical protein